MGDKRKLSSKMRLKDDFLHLFAEFQGGALNPQLARKGKCIAELFVGGPECADQKHEHMTVEVAQSASLSY